MKNLFLATTALIALAGGSAVAADMPVKGYAPPPPVYTWTGCYIGVGGGYKMWNIEHQRLDTTTNDVLQYDGRSGGLGWLVTGQVGCDYQFAGNWVLGAFADVDWVNARGDYFDRPLGNSSFGERRESGSWSVGGRLGYAVMPGLLTFVSGGWTQARFNATDFNSAFTGTPRGIQLPSQTYGGWFIGGGTEYNLGFLPGLTWKTEYRFATYGVRTNQFYCTSTVPGDCGPVGPITQADRSRLYQQTIRTELVYRFGGSAVVAKY